MIAACPDEDTILDFVSGQLSAEALAALDHHLDVCPMCIDLVVIAAAVLDEQKASAA